MAEAPKGRELWLEGGQVLLRRGGASAVKLHALAEELGLTTGSFYHHFTGMADYLVQLARHYGTDQVRAAVARIDVPDPRDRLRGLARLAIDEQMKPLDEAMRDWAGSNADAAEAVHRADTVMLRFIERAFVDLGYGRSDAQVRAQLLYCAGIARTTPPWRRKGRPLEAALEVLAP